jgi:hypothetical protein
VNGDRALPETKQVVFFEERIAVELVWPHLEADHSSLGL